MSRKAPVQTLAILDAPRARHATACNSPTFSMNEIPPPPTSVSGCAWSAALVMTGTPPRPATTCPAHRVVAQTAAQSPREGEGSGKIENLMIREDEEANAMDDGLI